jgi:hypothetical protein
MHDKLSMFNFYIKNLLGIDNEQKVAFDKHERFGRDIPTWPKKLLYAVSIFFIGGPGVWVVSVVGVILSLIFIPIIMGISWLYEKFQEKLVGKLKAWFLK